MLSDNMIIGGVYQIINELGSGGMGIVYLAYHLRLQKYVVLKQIKNSYADISLLRNEVDILKSLHHPYLPQVYDFVDYDGSIYTVIDYINGYDLNYYIRNGYSFSEGQLIKWLRQLCDVLEYLHSRSPKILHTDIKPGNIIVTTTGDICLIDFGISVYYTDTLKGLSENYSSPEQYGNYYFLQYGEGNYVQLDERTDIYSLGATMYHVLTGVSPDVKNTEQPAITAYALPYSDAFLGIIERCMQRDYNKRFRNAAAMRRAIDNIKKQDVRYKKYLLLQIAVSVVSVVMVLAGVFLVADGYNQDKKNRFSQEYNAFLEQADTGKYTDAAAAGLALLNDSSFSPLLTDSMRSQIAHKIGDCFYNEENYPNAAYYYRQAISFEPNELYYRDLIISLIQDNREEEASVEMDRVHSLYPSSAVIIVAEAQLSYEHGQYMRAVETVDAHSADFSGDSENFYLLEIIKGDAMRSLGKFSEAASAYETARGCKETVAVIRRQADAYMKLGLKNGNKADFRDALGCYEALRDQYSLSVDDAVNYSQSVLSLEEMSAYESCKQYLDDMVQTNEDIRLYIVLAELADMTDDPKAAAYCEVARSLYRNLSEEERAYISRESLSEIERLYKVHCGAEW